uniref:Uncharacterized protein n=1 Tax=Avena sativa TaxID=4498 RepID=A0ACD5XX23_AVESA
MEPEIEYEMPGFLRVHKSGHVERLDGTDTIQPSPSGDPANGVASKDVVLANSISARIYLPAAAAGAEPSSEKLPVVVFLHGGAFFIHTAGSLIYHRYAASLAAAVPAIVVSVEYRLAPEHPLPAAYDDAFAALQAVVAACRPDGGDEPWLAARGDVSRVVLAGDSAGGNMAHNTAIRLRKEGIGGYGDKVSDSAGWRSCIPTSRGQRNRRAATRNARWTSPPAASWAPDTRVSTFGGVAGGVEACW